MSQEHMSQEQEPKKPGPTYVVSRQLYALAAVVVAGWIFVTFFFRNPYQQAATGFDYYDKHPYDETSTWLLVLVVIPLIGLAGALSWFYRKAK